MNTGADNEAWQVEAGGQVYDTNFDEMQAWIAEGSLLRIDRVRKGDLRWIEAGKVPALTEFFNAKDAAAPPPPVITTTHTEVLGVAEPVQEFVNSPAQTFPDPAPAAAADACSMHWDAPAAYICDTCANSFCKACPKSYGGTVKICPLCGAMCKSLAQMEKVRVEASLRQHVADTPFGFGDFANALAHPFKFKASLIIGAVMFAIFSLGQSAFGLGGSIMLMVSAIFCILLTNMLSFGVLANTVENFSQGKLDQNFMPSFEDFSIWDDVVHPFFLSIGVYLSSFGPFFLVALVAFFMVLSAVKGEMNGLQADAARTVNPQLPYAANAVKQSEAVRELLIKTQDAQKKRMDAIERERNSLEESVASIESGAPRSTQTEPRWNAAEQEEKDIEAMQKMIVDQRKAQLESTIGKAPETVAADQEAFIQRILGYGAIFLLVGGITLVWGFFYFPAACAVAGYTRSFVATMNPSVGLDTIRRLGGTYALILLMGFLLLVTSGILSLFLGLIFLPFNLPVVGNLPAKFIGSMAGFYFSVVFSCVIGYALYKAADKLKLHR